MKGRGEGMKEWIRGRKSGDTNDGWKEMKKKAKQERVTSYKE